MGPFTNKVKNKLLNFSRRLNKTNIMFKDNTIRLVRTKNK